MSFVMTDEFSMSFLSVFVVFLTQKDIKHNFESHSSPQLSFVNIWGVHLNIVECDSFLGSNSTLVQCQANLDDSIDTGNFSVRG